MSKSLRKRFADPVLWVVTLLVAILAIIASVAVWGLIPDDEPKLVGRWEFDAPATESYAKNREPSDQARSYWLNKSDEQWALEYTPSGKFFYWNWGRREGDHPYRVLSSDGTNVSVLHRLSYSRDQCSYVFLNDDTLATYDSEFKCWLIYKRYVAGSDVGRPLPGHKNIVVLTPAAADRIRELIQEKHGSFLHVSLTPDREYSLKFSDEHRRRVEYLGESQGISILVDRDSAQLIPVGTTIDFVDEGKQQGFKFSFSDVDIDPPDTSISLAEARHGFKTKLIRRESNGAPVPEPPSDVFRLVRYESPAGKLAALLTPDPMDGKKRPAIVWITGGDSNTIDEGCWDDLNPQSAAVYRTGGLVMMIPSLRGGNDNPGVREYFFGELDDIVAAAKFLRSQPYVDPDRIYLGGHSTGGTLALLTAAYTDTFRAVFAFGPVEDVISYGLSDIPFSVSDRKEHQLRAPIRWLHSINVPVFVFEGTGGNLDSLQAMAHISTNPHVHFFEVEGADHFDVLSPTNTLIVSKIKRDTESTPNFTFSPAELNKPFVE